jgi:hypothetical protein
LREGGRERVRESREGKSEREGVREVGRPGGW